MYPYFVAFGQRNDLLSRIIDDYVEYWGLVSLEVDGWLARYIRVPNSYYGIIPSSYNHIQIVAIIKTVHSFHHLLNEKS